MLRAELYRAFWNRAFVLAMVVGTLMLAYWLTSYCSIGPLPGDHPFVCNAYDAEIWALEGPIGLVAPLLATLTFVDSLVIDRISGYLRHVLLRSSYRRYFLTKFSANLLVGGAALAIPLLLVFAYTNLIYPRGILPIEQSRIIPGGYPHGPFSTIYRTAPDLYILLRIGLSFIFGAVYATVGLMFASFINNRYVVQALPFLLYNVANFVIAVLGFSAWRPPITLTPELNTLSSSFTVFGELGAIFVASLACLGVLARKERTLT